MKFTTEINIPTSSWGISHKDSLMALGSCFAENIGSKLKTNRFQTDLNPFGVLYNPDSLETGIRRLLNPQPFESKDLFQHEGLFHSYAHHSQFSAADQSICLDNINQRLFISSDRIQKETTRLLITFGSAYVYRLKNNGEVVSNCHKMPDKLFTRERLSVQSIVLHWKDLLENLCDKNPNLKIIFTVSPIRHWKEGANANQLSKATLLLAVNEIVQLFPDNASYFPAYEIMLDELRDYRFYKADMIHPSELAIDYIWKRFSDTYFSKETQITIKQIGEVNKALQHRPFNSLSGAYKQFLTQTLLKMERLHEKSPYLYSLNDLEELRKKIIT